MWIKKRISILKNLQIIEYSEIGILDTIQNFSPDALPLDSLWDAVQDSLLDVLLDSLPDTLPYTSPFQTDFEQWYALPNLTKLFFFIFDHFEQCCSYWCLLNVIINMSGGEKIEFWKFFPTAHINVCLEQTSIWAVSGSHRSTAQPLILMVPVLPTYLYKIIK